MVKVRNAVSYWPRCEPDVAVAYLPTVPVLTRRLACCAESFPQRRRAQKVDCTGSREESTIARILYQTFHECEQSVGLHSELMNHHRKPVDSVVTGPEVFCRR